MDANLVNTSPVTVCTLWEGDYHKGLGALANSLARCGYRGTIWAGYRGDLPAWADKGVTTGETDRFPLADGVEIAFVKLETAEHFAHYKPTWAYQVLQQHDPAATGIYYFDPDIVALADWSFFESWIEAGIAVCEDTHYPLNPTHPRSLAWQAFATESGLAIQRPAESNLNSGLFGLKREAAEFLQQWEFLLKTARSRYELKAAIRQGTRAFIFHIPDQDTFTIATWTAAAPVSRMGLDAMGFSQGEWLSVHATEGTKPWRRRVFRDLLTKGIAPDRALRLYWQFAAGPAPIETASRVKMHRWLIPFTALLSRFYRRS